MADSSPQFIPLGWDRFIQGSSKYIPSYMQLFELDPETHTGWIATHGSHTIRFIWGRIQNKDKKSTRYVYNLAVAAKYRNAGTGAELLRRFQLDSIEGDVYSLSVVANEQSHGLVLHLLERGGWDKPKVASYCYRAALDKVFESAPWINKDRRYCYRQYIFPWSNLTDEERTQLEDEKGPGSWRDEITPSSPLFFQKHMNPIQVLAYESRGEIAGWNITGMYEPDTLLYGSYFVRKHFRNADRFIAGIPKATAGLRDSQLYLVCSRKE